MSHVGSQVGIRAVYVRGGTSRAIVFRAEDLPTERARWDRIFLAALGSPDPNGRQLDGLGGGVTSLSKIAVVGPPSRPGADVDYTIAQVGATTPTVQYSANCGNISAAIGPFAVDEGLVPPREGETEVRIHNTNTGKIIVARFPVKNGKAAVDGDFEVAGVAGTGAPIKLAFLDPGGATTGKLFPTGEPRTMLDVPGRGAIDVSLVDASNPVVFVSAATLGLGGTELPDILSKSSRLALLENIRAAAAVRMGLAKDLAEAQNKVRAVPFVGIVAPPLDAPTLSGVDVAAKDMDITLRMICSNQPHNATPLTGAMCLAVAVRCPGTIPHQLARQGSGDIRIGHPSGILPVAAVVRGDPPVAESAIVYRTARRLMEGKVLVPASKII
jgi:2-methylaconitate cis-trans-isomerase PrpF